MRSVRAMTAAVKSKYAHQIAATPTKATASESANAASRVWSASPDPIATIDSPSAMMMNSA